MAFYAATMLSMALELASEDPAYEDMASKFFEHFVDITDAMNSLDGTGLWDEEDGFYYDRLHVDGTSIPLKVRSLVGLLPLIAVEVLEDGLLNRLPGFKKRMEWFLANRRDLARHISRMERGGDHDGGHRLLAIPSGGRLRRVLTRLLDENEFLSPHGIRSVSRVHEKEPCVVHVGGAEHRVHYVPAESTTGLFGGNSNWRGPIWFPVNFLLVEAIERYHHVYGDGFRVECPTGSGRLLDLRQVAREISRRLASIFLADGSGRQGRPGGGEGGTELERRCRRRVHEPDRGSGRGPDQRRRQRGGIRIGAEHRADRLRLVGAADDEDHPGGVVDHRQGERDAARLRRVDFNGDDEPAGFGERRRARKERRGVPVGAEAEHDEVELRNLPLPKAEPVAQPLLAVRGDRLGIVPLAPEPLERPRRERHARGQRRVDHPVVRGRVGVVDQPLVHLEELDARPVHMVPELRLGEQRVGLPRRVASGQSRGEPAARGDRGRHEAYDLVGGAAGQRGRIGKYTQRRLHDGRKATAPPRRAQGAYGLPASYPA
jgi:hypothetical protein